MFTNLELGALVLPTIITAVLYLRYPRKIVVAELLAVVVAFTTVFIGLKAISSQRASRDVQFTTLRVRSATHKDPISGLTPTAVGDVTVLMPDDTPERNFVTAGGAEFAVEPGYYQQLRKRWGNPTKRGEDEEFLLWPGDDESAVFVMKASPWDNRLQFTQRGERYLNVARDERERFDLKEYPFEFWPGVSEHGLDVSSILGKGCRETRESAEQGLSTLNANLAKTQDPQFWILLFLGQPKKAADLQEALWGGGNANEFVVCLGLDAQEGGPFQWVHCFTWAQDDLAEQANKDIVDLDTGDLNKVVGYLGDTVAKRWKPPVDPNIAWYEVRLSIARVTLLYVMTAVISIVFLFVAIHNGIEKTSKRVCLATD